MLQTIEVEIDAKGRIHPLENLPLPHKGKTRALLTILQALPATQEQPATTSRGTQAFGILTASHSITLDEMEAVIRKRGSRL